MVVQRSLPNPAVIKIREQINHPIIDADGHVTEFMPLVRDFILEVGGPELSLSNFIN